MTQAQTLTHLVEQKQKEAAGWELLHKVLTEVNLTPEQDRLVHAVLGLESDREVEERRATMERLSEQLGAGEHAIRVNSSQQPDGRLSQ